jgi:hypothetical protein
MRAPADKRSDEEIADDILRVVDVRGIVIGEKPKNRRIAPIRPIVLRLINDLRAELPPFTGHRKDNEEYVKELREQIDRFRKILTRAPQPLSAALFAPEMFFRFAELQGSILGINPQTRTYLSQTPTRLALLLAQLDWLRAQCDQILRIELGTHKSLDQRKLDAAIASRELLEFAANVTGRKLTLSWAHRTSKYCELASLFFEAATGEYGADLRRQCETAAPPPRRTNP